MTLFKCLIPPAQNHKYYIHTIQRCTHICNSYRRACVCSYAYACWYQLRRLKLCFSLHQRVSKFCSEIVVPTIIRRSVFPHYIHDCSATLIQGNRYSLLLHILRYTSRGFRLVVSRSAITLILVLFS